jgi:hypothetical protein
MRLCGAAPCHHLTTTNLRLRIAGGLTLGGCLRLSDLTLFTASRSLSHCCGFSATRGFDPLSGCGSRCLFCFAKALLTA